MSRIKIKFQIPYPTFIESIVVYFLLRYRKKHYGVAFRRIKLYTDKPVAANHRYTIVDPDDYQKLAEYNWQLCDSETGGYVLRLAGHQFISMHRVIMNAPKGKIVDHIDRNGLNNTKINLRFATRRQNNCNVRRETKTKTSKYKGVSFTSKIKKWRAQIKYDETTKHLGYFDNEEDAARAYDEAAKIYHGQFAALNFGPSSPAASTRQAETQRINNEKLKIALF